MYDTKRAKNLYDTNGANDAKSTNGTNDMTHIITVANQKGGCGKTTIAMGLAGTYGLRGKKVLVVDADLQGTATRWAASAPDETPFPAAVMGLAAVGGKLHREVKKYVDDYDVIVIDCPPAVDSSAPQSALLISDVAIVPVVPSPADLWAARGIKKIIENVGDINEALNPVLVANMVPRTALGREALNTLEDFGIRLAQTSLGQRTAYREAVLYGCPVQTLGSKARNASDEINKLADEIWLLATGGTQ